MDFDSEENKQKLATLEEKCPKSTLAERKRLLKAKGGDEAVAAEQLSRYLSWREEHQAALDKIWGDATPDYEGEEDLDLINWKIASTVAVVSQVEKQAAEENKDAAEAANGDNKTENSGKFSYSLPRLARTFAWQKEGEEAPKEPPQPQPDGKGAIKLVARPPIIARDLDGHIIFHASPAMIDINNGSLGNEEFGSLPTTAPVDKNGALTLDMYEQAVGNFLDYILDSTGEEKLTCLLDVRGGEGWPNPSILTIAPAIQKISNLLNDKFAERCHKCLVYPLPWTAKWVWDTAVYQEWIDPETAKKVEVFSGAASRDDPAPMEQLSAHVDKDLLLHIEQERKKYYKYDK